MSDLIKVAETDEFLNYDKDSFAPMLYGEKLKLIFLKETDSTNEAAKRYLAQEKIRNALIVAKLQTAGKGRRGRTFYSPADEGIYMSLLFTPKEGLEDIIAVTTAASVIVARAIESVSGQKVSVKWVNDLYAGGRKICGILAEAVLPTDENDETAVILGIGINVGNESFPDELKDIAGSLHAGIQTNLWKKQLIQTITKGLCAFLEDIKNTSYLEEYRQRSMVIGREIICYEGNCTYCATATDIDERGGLVVIDEKGERKVLHSGEITIRLSNL